MTIHSSSQPRIHIFGHSSAQPWKFAEEFGGETDTLDVGQCDLAIFVLNPSAGIDPETIAQWAALDELMVPRLICVTGLGDSQADFDDGVMLANRVLDTTLTPYLVLHDEEGMAAALIDLKEMKILDYSTQPPQIRPSEPEHQTLVQEFREEYLAAIDVMGEDAFAAGLIFPAIPVWIEKGIGVDIVKKYIAELAP